MSRSSEKRRRPGTAAFRAVVRRAGDDCSLCRRPLRSGEMTSFGYIGHRLHLVGTCCADRVSEAWGIGLYIAGPRPWLDDDRKWFERNRLRSHRLRRAFDGETMQGQSAPWVAVRQIKPGQRQRIGFDPPLPPPDDEAVAHALFDALVEAAAEGRTRITTREIIARADRLAVEGRA